VPELTQHLILDKNQLKDEKAIKIMTKLRFKNLKQQKIKRRNCKRSRNLIKMKKKSNYCKRRNEKQWKNENRARPTNIQKNQTSLKLFKLVPRSVSNENH
jgi:hypothetical protein